jgi:hypothetical protein
LWFGNYHIGTGSAAAGIGADTGINLDFDLQPRSTVPDAGADEIP